MSRPSHARTIGASLIALLAALLMLPGPSACAAPSASSRFWGYYQLTDGAWAFATTGADQQTPADGSVEGWRYAVGDLATPRLPRAVATFEQACATTPATPDTKRVGVVIDYGRQADAPEGAGEPPAARVACAQVPTAATGAQVLAAVAEVRVEDNLVCGVDSFPATGCFEEVATPSPEVTAADEPVTLATAAPGEQAHSGDAAADQQDDQAEQDSGAGVLTWVALAVVLLAVVAALWLSKRRRGSHEGR